MSQIYPFKILSEGSVAAGTRRIEAVAGHRAIQHYHNAYNDYCKVAKKLGCNISAVYAKVE